MLTPPPYRPVRNIFIRCQIVLFPDGLKDSKGGQDVLLHRQLQEFQFLNKARSGNLTPRVVDFCIAISNS